MSTYTTGYDKKYMCVDCGATYYDIDEINIRVWKCPKCNGELDIAAPNLASGHLLRRIQAKDLKISDGVNIPHTNKVFDVLDVNRLENGKIRVAYKNYTVINYDETDFVTTVMGRYCESE